MLKVLISSPGDTGDEVAAVMESLHGWNGSRAESAQVILLPRHWRADAVPRLGAGSGQVIINKQLVDDADIVIALFDSRLGQATADAVSGTAEEIQRAVDAGKHVHVWFSNEPIARRAADDLEQLAALQKFRTDLQTQGLLGEYDNPADLGYKVRSAVEDDVTQMGLGSPAVRRRGVEHAMPRARRDGDYLVIKNKSNSVTAEQFRFVYEGVWPYELGTPGREPIDLFYDGKPFDLLPDSDMSWSMSVFHQSPPQLKLTMHWTENGEPQEAVQIVAL